MTLQNCSDFCHTLIWISHGFTLYFYLLFLAVLGLHYCEGFSLVAGSRDYSSAAASHCESESESYSVVSNPMDCSLQAPPFMETSRQEILEWVAISFSRGSFRPRDGTWVSYAVGRLFTIWATREASLVAKHQLYGMWASVVVFPSSRAHWLNSCDTWA